MRSCKMIARFPTAGVILVAAVPVTKAEEMEKDNAQDLSHFKVRRCDLPLYAPLHARNKPLQVSFDHKKKSDSVVRSSLEGACSVVRKEVQSGFASLEKQKESVMNIVNTAKSHSQSSIDYLNQPHNILPRTGAIAMGGLAGFIFAARGGFLKKVLYTTFGAGGIASLCYPEQASIFARESLYEARKGYAIAYNFVKGVKPGDEVPVEPINKFPTSFEDLKLMLWDLYDETVETLFPKKS